MAAGAAGHRGLLVQLPVVEVDVLEFDSAIIRGLSSVAIVAQVIQGKKRAATVTVVQVKHTIYQQ